MAEDHAYGIKEKVLVLREMDKPALGAVRCLAGLHAALRNGQIWVRGVDIEPVEKAILQLPVLHTYLLDAEGRLFPSGGHTPVARLEALDWQPLHEFIPLELPASALPGMVIKKLEVVLVPDTQERESSALITSLEVWKSYGGQAPLVRLQRLQFAVSEDDSVLIIGTPVPPIPGKAFTLQESILLPAGYAFDPPGIHTLINSRLNPDSDGYLVFNTDGSCQRIPASYCIPATRSAIRMTKGGRHG